MKISQDQRIHVEDKFIKDDNKSRNESHIRIKAFNYLDKNMQRDPYSLKFDQKKLSSATKMARQALTEALGATKYHRAAYDNYLDLLCAASKRDANATTQQQALTPTLIAAQQGHLEALRMLVGRGGNPEKCDSSGSACLHLAAAQNHLNCVSFLVNFGVNMWSLDNEWHTAKDVAAICQGKEVLEYLDQMMARQSAINTKQVQKFKEKASKSAEKRMKQLRKSQLKLLKQNERDERHFFKLANSRPMLKNNLPISDIRLVGKPLIKYSPSYNSASNCNNIGANNPKNYNVKPVKLAARSCSTTDLTVASYSSCTSNSHVNVSDCIKTFEMAFEGENKAAKSKKTILPLQDARTNGAEKFEYDSGVSGGSTVSKISSKPSPTSTTRTTSSPGSQSDKLTTLSDDCTFSSNASAFGERRLILVGHQSKRMNNQRPCYSDLVAIKSIDSSYRKSLAGSSTGSSDGAKSSSLMERARSSKALSGATKLNLRKLLKVSQRLTYPSTATSRNDFSSKQDLANRNRRIDIASSVSSINCEQIALPLVNRNITYSKYNASMVDLRSGGLSETKMANNGKQSPNKMHPDNKSDHLEQSCVTATDKKNPYSKMSKQKLSDSERDDYHAENIKVKSNSRHNIADHQTIKWSVTPKLSRAISQSDFGVSSTERDANNDKIRECNHTNRTENDERAQELDQMQDDLIGQDHLIGFETTPFESSSSQVGIRSHETDRSHQSEPVVSGQLNEEQELARNHDNQQQHHLMLNECLSQLKLHRKQQVNILKSAGSNQRIQVDLSRANICTSSTELLQHQLQAGELPLKPSLIKQHQMVLSKALAHPSQEQRLQRKGPISAVADSIGSATSLAQRTNGESFSIASSSTNSSAKSTASAAWSSSRSSMSPPESMRNEAKNCCHDAAKFVKTKHSNLPTIESFLSRNGFGDGLSDIFAREMIDFEALLLLGESDLKSINVLLGPRKKLLKAIETFKRIRGQEESHPATELTSCDSLSPVAQDDPKPPPPPPLPPAFLQTPIAISVVDTKL